jgi:hypothetical protein
MTLERPRTASIATALVAALVAALLFAFEPASTWWFPSCPLRALTGWLCPFCGTLRALHALLHGNPGRALALNPLVTLGALAGVAAWVGDMAGPTGRSRFARWFGLWFSAPGVAVLITFGVLRNLPVDRITQWL